MVRAIVTIGQLVFVCTFAVAALNFASIAFFPLFFQIIYPFLPVCFLFSFLILVIQISGSFQSFSKPLLLGTLFNGLVLMIFYGIPTRYYSEDAKGASLKVLIWNTQQFNNDTAAVTQSIAKIKALSPDVLLLQEFGLYYKWPDTKSVAADFAQRAGFSYWDFSPKTGDIFGTACFSKWPIVYQEPVFQWPNTTNEAKYYRIVIHDDTLALVNAHLMSYNINGDKVLSLSNIEDVCADRLQQASLIKSKNADLYGGDFNSAPGDLVYELFRDFANDAYVGSLSPTHKWLPARLDHCFLNREWGLKESKIIHGFPSDHHALWVDLIRND